MKKGRIIAVAVVAVALVGTWARAQETPSDKPAQCAALEADLFIDLKEVIKAGCTPSPAQISKLLENPVGNFVAIPFQYDYITVKGPHVGDSKGVHRLQITPTFPIRLGSDWNDRCTLFDLSPVTGLTTIHSHARAGLAPQTEGATSDTFPWYLDRARRGEAMILERLPDALPVEAAAEREYVPRSGMKSHVGLPLAVGGSVVCLLGIAAFRTARTWPPQLVGRLRLAVEELANALHRKRTAQALESELAEISELQAHLEAENVYLREEISGARGFEDIVGDSPALKDVLRRVALVAPTDTAVLLRGETGTGKEI